MIHRPRQPGPCPHVHEDLVGLNGPFVPRIAERTGAAVRWGQTLTRHHLGCTQNANWSILVNR